MGRGALTDGEKEGMVKKKVRNDSKLREEQVEIKKRLVQFENKLKDLKKYCYCQKGKWNVGYLLGSLRKNERKGDDIKEEQKRSGWIEEAREAEPAEA